ncbi:MAG: DUF4382 domain-containing protein [Spirochaetes bacterium]|nr:DUF4382 domain-containing protein [Spirochaetota bacterium]MBU0955578.1 DUF4382 domain-containing protein [Spirochaetota bacterium]
MKKHTGIFVLLAAIMLMLVSCNPAADAEISFALTDAPVDSSTISAVTISVSKVSVNQSTDGNISDNHGSWIDLPIEPAVVVNLLDLQNGATEVLGNLPIAGGTQINQIRLTVDSLVVTDNGSDITASIPSTTGLKIVNAFQVPLSGNVSVTIDFDVRKSLVENAGGYMLKPAIRAVVDNEAGKITGTAPAGSIIYAYAGDTWNEAAETTANADGLKFTAAYSSTLAADAGTFTLAFMDAGLYTLVAVAVADDSILYINPVQVMVEADKTTANVVMVP